MSENDTKKEVFEMKKNCPQRSYAHVDCSFDNPAENFLLNVRKSHKKRSFSIEKKFAQNVPMHT